MRVNISRRCTDSLLKYPRKIDFEIPAKGARNFALEIHKIIISRDARSHAPSFPSSRSRFGRGTALCNKYSPPKVSHTSVPRFRARLSLSHIVLLQFVEKFNAARTSPGWIAGARVSGRAKFCMTESVACKFLSAGRYISRRRNVSECSRPRERPNNSRGTCVRGYGGWAIHRRRCSS